LRLLPCANVDASKRSNSSISEMVTARKVERGITIFRETDCRRRWANSTNLPPFHADTHMCIGRMNSLDYDFPDFPRGRPRTFGWRSILKQCNTLRDTEAYVALTEDTLNNLQHLFFKERGKLER
jgi:hypothetical protein